MIRDLDACGDHPHHLEAEVLVIGAGIAGLLTATRLADAGRRVVVAESGGRAQESETHPLNAVEQTGQVYAGARHGRFRCLGGTSTRWGGAMIPFLPEDLDCHTAGWVPDWGVPYDRLMSHLPEIERTFGLPAGPYEDRTVIDPGDAAAGGFIARCPKWPPFRKRNVAAVLESSIRSSAGPEIWLNATITALAFDPGGRVRGATARSTGGGRLEIRAGIVVVAAGAIESTRLLLVADRQCDDRLFSPDDVLGRYLTDHLSAPVAALVPRDRIALNRLVGFRFEGAAMRNLRFEMLGTTRRRLGLPASFIHIAYEGGAAGGFEALRDALRTLQQRRLPRLADLRQIAADAPWLAGALWWRYVHRRLLYPSSGAFTVQLVTEQMPRRENRISLADQAVDPFGLPLARIAWRVGDEDESAAHEIAGHFFGMWRQSRFARLADLVPRNDAARRAELATGGAVYHPAGTIRIGRSPLDGVVDAELRCFRVPNLYVVSTATFPVVGGANPTLTMMLYACALAEQLGSARLA